tara:strand:+ start:22 stop:648 length:627 start_codon:yes stop_codon:yes gene_type:complete
MGLISNGTTIFDAGALDSGLAKGAMTFIKKLTASSSGTLSFVNGSSGVVLDSTYKEYMFTFKDIHSSADNADLQFNGSDDTSSHSYNITKTTTNFRAYHFENDAAAAIQYQTSNDLAQSTGFQNFFGDDGVGNDNDQCAVGYMHLFNPSSTTFVKHFTAVTNMAHTSDLSVQNFMAGYFNTTAAITAIQFKFDTGNIDAGDICLYGIS